ncbi:hypothetical protein C0991_011208 [Blastosporella zonata]|nr:hypothetical protein C0991_011208 [Blastosporella zonata]
MLRPEIASTYGITVENRPPALSLGSAQLQYIPSADVKELPNYAGMNHLVEITKTEEQHELLDALSPIYDQLSLA